MIQKHLLSLFMVLSFSLARAQFSGNALDFDGSNDLVDITTVPAALSNPSTNDFTVEAWVNPRGSVFARILFAQASTSNFVSLGTNTGNIIYFYVIKNGTTVSVATTTGIPQNQWTHVAARWTSATSTAAVFFNGVLQPTVSGGSSSTGTSGVMAIGARTGGSQYFNGQLDELRVWSSALSQCDIQANMNNTLPTAQANLIMNYNYNQGTAGATNTTVTALPDLSGNAYNGTLTNFALTGATSNWVSSTASVTATGYSTTAASAVTSQTNISCNGTNNGIASVTASGIGPFTYTWIPAGGNAATATGLGAGNYTVMVANACATLTKTLSLTQAPAIVLNATAGSTAICVGSSSTLTANASGGTGTMTYTWSGGASSGTTVVTPTSNTVYTVHVTDANNCAKSATVGITVNALPSVSLTAASSSVCVNSGSIALTGTPSGGTYSGTNVSGTAFTPVSSGTFTPAYSFTNTTTGCSATATTTIVVSLCTGIEAVDVKETLISIYPNPNNGAFTIALFSRAEVSIANAIGSQVLASQTMEAGIHSLDLSKEAGGIYFVKVIGNRKQSIIRLVKR
jgi:hypothetical protein